jgi:hypothetical protein
MPFIKVSHPKTQDPQSGDFFINSNYVMRILPRDSGSLLFMHDGSTVAVEQAPDTIADFVDQVETNRAEIKVNTG